MERVIWKLTLTYGIRQPMGICGMAQENQTGFCINLEEWDGEGDGGSFKREGIYVYLWLIHVELLQKTTKFCKAIIRQ